MKIMNIILGAVLMIYFRKWTAFSNTLIILCGIAAHYLRLFHFNPKIIFHKINSRKDGQVGIPFTTAGSANHPYLSQSL